MTLLADSDVERNELNVTKPPLPSAEGAFVYPTHHLLADRLRIFDHDKYQHVTFPNIFLQNPLTSCFQSSKTAHFMNVQGLNVLIPSSSEATEAVPNPIVCFHGGA
ncbi:MAG: hypothetical protein ABH871_06800 [Pseudomonadota bacterium]